MLLDFLVAFCLAKVAVIHHHQQVEGQRTQKQSLGNGVEVIMIKEDHDFHMFVMACYLFNPFTIITCGGYSTLLLTNLSIIFAVWMKLRGSDLLSALGLALAVNFSLYPVMLFCPLVLMAYKDGRLLGSLKYLLWCSVWGGTILFISYRVTGSWDFLQAVYGIMLTVSDLTPNVGLFWYFFTEAFEHFRVFFLCVFQINAFIYVLPLSVRFSDQPLFLTYILLSLMALFKSYPCVGDLTLPLALLPLWSHTFSYLRYTLVVLTMFLVASVLGPVLWYLWIHAGSANANFFFAMTLVYCLAQAGTWSHEASLIAQVFLISDTIYAFLVYNYDLLHGLPRVDKDGKPIKLKLA
eukprot:Em0018g655a